MPMRLYNASTKHVNDNLWLWIGISSAAMLAIGVAETQMTFGRGEGLGNWVALAGAVLGILLMLKSEAEMPVVVAPEAP